MEDGHTETVKVLIEQGALENIRTDNNQMLPLFLVASDGQIASEGDQYKKILDLRATHGLTLDLPGYDENENCAGMSALAYAAYKSYYSTSALLLSVPGVNAHTLDFYGRSLLWWTAVGLFASPRPSYRYLLVLSRRFTRQVSP
jgi:hypothetical protein